MKPVNDIFFGNSTNDFGHWGIKVEFHNGSGVVDGFIVKQLSTTKFIVSDGSVEYTCKFAKDGTPSVAGEMTIIIKKIVNWSSGGQPDEHVVKFVSGRKMKTVEGNTYIFAFNTSPYYPNVPKIDAGHYGAITPYT